MSESFVVNHSTATLSEACSHLTATSSGELVFFAGEYNATGQASARVDILNVSSGIWTTTTLSLNLVLNLQPHPHEILSSLVEVTMEQ
jgi:hypothetical protein